MRGCTALSRQIFTGDIKWGGEIDGIEREYKDRPNLVARLGGNGGGKSIFFSGHMNIVPVMEDAGKLSKIPIAER